MNYPPKSGEIYRHRKHDPNNGKWHEYKVVCLVEPGNGGDENSPRCFSAIHTETSHWHDILPATDGTDKSWAWPAVDKPHVCYKSTRDDSGKTWLRPLDMFMDGRFSKVVA